MAGRMRCHDGGKVSLQRKRKEKEEKRSEGARSAMLAWGYHASMPLVKSKDSLRINSV